TSETEVSPLPVFIFQNNNEEDEEMNVVRQVESVDLDKIQYSHSRFFDVINGESFVLVKTVRHRNKRFSSYLTLCPFKICSMGRKRLRSRRYIKPIRAPAQDNEGT
ncbi:hypothetical protein NQ315_006432, partial [Exocentrus adspersus]